MTQLQHVPVASLPTERFREVIGPEDFARFEAAAERARRMFEGRVVWNVNSTPRGGGVAEMLRSLLAYARGAGVDARWVVIGGRPDFFAVTKRIHNFLHGAPGDGGDVGDAERRIYETTLAASAAELAELVRPEDVVILHDPQTAGLTAAVAATGAPVVWRCHVGLDLPNELARTAWRFLIPYVADARAYVFSRRAFAWEGLHGERVTVIPPSIDAFSPKNQELDPEAVGAILDAARVVPGGAHAAPVFVREDGTPGRVDRHADMIEDGPVPPGARLVVQVSRWDRLKDPRGVITGFVDNVAPHHEAHLMLAGPSVEAVADDPEGADVLAECIQLHRGLPPPVRARIHLACLPMDDSEENAAIVNALQRRADIVVQKSIAEGFGLTVAEAMWKARPVVASRIGGIQDQIDHGVCGLLVDDPDDLAAYGRAVADLLADPERAERLGASARTRVKAEFLGPRHLIQYVDLIDGLFA